MKYKNYYKILGLKGPAATNDEIKVAYRKLAKRYHPDNNKGNHEAEEKFKDISEAWETLGSATKKKRYNVRYYAHFMQNGFDLTDLPGSIKNLENSDFIKVFIGEAEPEDQNKDSLVAPDSLDNEITIKLTLNEAFNGVVKQITYSKSEEISQTISVKIPRGANDSSQVLLKGEGKINEQTGETGDLHIKFALAKSTVFELQGNNLLREVKVSPSDIVLGNTINVDSIDGKYKLKIPDGTKDNDICTIKEAGFISKDGKRGDLLVKIKMQIPKL